jgi:hypothetical protein
MGGLAGGALVFFRTTKPMMELVYVNLALYQSERTYAAYRYGSYPVARTRILEYIDQVGGLAAGEQAPTLGKGTPSDLALWYGRLAVAAERAGRPHDAPGYVRLGLEKMRTAGSEMTEGQLRELVQMQDVAWDDDLRR